MEEKGKKEESLFWDWVQICFISGLYVFLVVFGAKGGWELATKLCK